MSRFPSRIRILLTAALVAGCSSAKDDSRAQMDSTLARDLALATTSSSAPVTFGDTAISNTGSKHADAPAPARAQPRTTTTAPRQQPPRVAERPRPAQTPTRPVPAPVQTPVAQAPTPVVTAPPAPVTPAPTTTGSSDRGSTSAGRSPGIGAGAVLTGRTSQQICSIANRPGDRFVVTLGSDVVGTDGGVLPAGTPVVIELASTPDEGPFGFRVKAVQVAGDLVTVQGGVRADGAMTERRVSEGNDKAKVVGGAVAGAILGKVLGGGTKGAVVGAAAGGAAGTIAASRSGKVERCLPAGSSVTITLSSPLVLASGTQ